MIIARIDRKVDRITIPIFLGDLTIKSTIKLNNFLVLKYRNYETKTKFSFILDFIVVTIWFLFWLRLIWVQSSLQISIIYAHPLKQMVEAFPNRIYQEQRLVVDIKYSASGSISAKAQVGIRRQDTGIGRTSQKGQRSNHQWFPEIQWTKSGATCQTICIGRTNPRGDERCGYNVN